MTTLRPLERADLPEVASLYERVVRSGSVRPAPGLERYFARTLLDHPWTDDEVPSLVAVEPERGIVGFIGSHVRRLRWAERPIRAAFSGQLVADPQARNRAVGAFLVRRYVRGPQDLTLTDGATATVRRMWDALGGEPAPLRSLAWTRTFKPFRGTGAALAESGRRLLMRGPVRTAGRVREIDVTDRIHQLGRPLAAVLQRSSGPPRKPRYRHTTDSLDADSIIEALPRMARGFECRPAYDPAFLRWLFDEMATVTVRGALIRRLVRDRTGAPAGWFVYYAKRGGTSQVLQIVATPRRLPDVFEAVLHDAWERGSAALSGRVERGLLPLLAEQRCAVHYADWVLVSSRHADLQRMAEGEGALLTRMDGEWWMGHHLHILPSPPNERS